MNPKRNNPPNNVCSWSDGVRVGQSETDRSGCGKLKLPKGGKRPAEEGFCVFLLQVDQVEEGLGRCVSMPQASVFAKFSVVSAATSGCLGEVNYCSTALGGWC